MRHLARNTAEIEIAARGKRRHRSKEERRRIVEESLAPGASVAVIARAHGVNANQVFHWRKLYRQGRLDANPSPLLPVRVTEVFETRRCRPRRQPRKGRVRGLVKGDAFGQALFIGELFGLAV
jgi:transposase-like protein